MIKIRNYYDWWLRILMTQVLNICLSDLKKRYLYTYKIKRFCMLRTWSDHTHDINCIQERRLIYVLWNMKRKKFHHMVMTNTHQEWNVIFCWDLRMTLMQKDIHDSCSRYVIQIMLKKYWNEMWTEWLLID